MPLGTYSLYGKFGVAMPSGSFTVHNYVHFWGQKHSLIIKDSKFNMLLHKIHGDFSYKLMLVLMLICLNFCMSKIIYIPLLVQDKYLKVDILKFVPKIVPYRTRVKKITACVCY